MSKLHSVSTSPVLWPPFWGSSATAQSHNLVGKLLKLLPSLLWGYVAQPSLTGFYFQSHSLPTGLPRARKDHPTLLMSFSNWYISDPAVAGRRFLKWCDFSCSESHQSFNGFKHPSHRSHNWRTLGKSKWSSSSHFHKIVLFAKAQGPAWEHFKTLNSYCKREYQLYSLWTRKQTFWTGLITTDSPRGMATELIFS